MHHLYSITSTQCIHVVRSCKLVNQFTVNSPAMIIAISKCKSSSKTILSNWCKALLWIVWKPNKMAVRKWGLLSQNTAKLANLDTSHSHPPEIFSEGIYLNSQIFGTSQHAKFSEKTAVIRRRFIAKIFFVTM